LYKEIGGIKNTQRRSYYTAKLGYVEDVSWEYLLLRLIPVKHRVLAKGACDYIFQILTILSPQSPTFLAKVMTTWWGLEGVDCMDSFSADMALVGATVVAVCHMTRLALAQRSAPVFRTSLSRDLLSLDVPIILNPSQTLCW
jgi:hypothetical protein